MTTRRAKTATRLLLDRIRERKRATGQPMDAKPVYVRTEAHVLPGDGEVIRIPDLRRQFIPSEPAGGPRPGEGTGETTTDAVQSKERPMHTEAETHLPQRQPKHFVPDELDYEGDRDGRS